jgi:hypothetical protein
MRLSALTLCGEWGCPLYHSAIVLQVNSTRYRKAKPVDTVESDRSDPEDTLDEIDQTRLSRSEDQSMMYAVARTCSQIPGYQPPTTLVPPPEDRTQVDLLHILPHLDPFFKQSSENSLVQSDLLRIGDLGRSKGRLGVVAFFESLGQIGKENELSVSGVGIELRAVLGF